MQHSATHALRVTDLHESQDAFLEDVLEGLGRLRKSIPSKYFYDQQGSELFEQITELDEYYPTRTELGIMRASQAEIVGAVGPKAMIVEYGSGSSTKTRLLLDRLEDPVAYVPIDISGDHLVQSAHAIAARYPGLEVLPLIADYTEDIRLPEPVQPAERVVVYFPGSTIGNFDREEIGLFLSRAADACGSNGGLLIGVDLVKDVGVLERAYNDANGVTAAFNLNVLRRINRELQADFRLDAFEHKAIWNPVTSRIEMHLVSRLRQVATVADRHFGFEAGETIHTENSHKFTVKGFATIAAPWFRQEHVWTDERGYFSLQYLQAR